MAFRKDDHYVTKSGTKKVIVLKTDNGERIISGFAAGERDACFTQMQKELNFASLQNQVYVVSYDRFVEPCWTFEQSIDILKDLKTDRLLQTACMRALLKKGPHAKIREMDAFSCFTDQQCRNIVKGIPVPLTRGFKHPLSTIGDADHLIEHIAHRWARTLCIDNHLQDLGIARYQAFKYIILKSCGKL